MIHNLKSKLESLPKSDIKKERAPSYDYDCSVFINETAIADDELLLSFAESNTLHLKTACKISDDTMITPEEIAFFDTETTGLAGGSGTVAFLVGVGRFEGDKFIVRQFLMNDYHQETSVLREFASSLAGAKAVATYNGKSFDAPLITARSIMNRVSVELDKYVHFDLLHACRRLYKLRLGRMKLTDIEEQVLGDFREDDIPGSEIPEIFFKYLKYGDKNLLDSVIEHNLKDIISLAKISAVLSGAYSAPQAIEEAEDRYSAAKTLISLDIVNQAKSLLLSVKDELKQAKAELAYLLRAIGDYEQAAELFCELADESKFDIQYDIEAAKIYEHRVKDYKQALSHAVRAKDKLFNAKLLGREILLADDVEKRIMRINKKMEGKK